MKKFILFHLLVGFLVFSWSPAMAKKEAGALPAPSNLSAKLYPESICFSWDPVAGATKYSLDVNVSVDRDGDRAADQVVEFSFGTGERTDGRDPSDPNLCVPLADFVFDLNGDGVLEPVFGPAFVKVKALNPGKGSGRQNHAFSAEYETTLSDQDSPPDPLLPPDPLTQPDPLIAP